MASLKLVGYVLAARALWAIALWSTPQGELYWAAIGIATWWTTRQLWRAMFFLDATLLPIIQAARAEADAKIKATLPCWPPTVVR